MKRKGEIKRRVKLACFTFIHSKRTDSDCERFKKELWGIIDDFIDNPRVFQDIGMDLHKYSMRTQSCPNPHLVQAKMWMLAEEVNPRIIKDYKYWLESMQK